MSNCCVEAPALDLPAGHNKVVLAGNPNVGKSAIFHALTGVYVEVSNFPGTTVDISAGQMDGLGIYDTPGVYGVSAFNEEERVAREMILQADVIVNVVDAAHLDRDLFLTLQIIDMGFPLVVALNMMDEAEAHGLQVNVDQLAAELGVAVIPTVAVKGQGLDQLRNAIRRARPGRGTPGVTERLPEGLSPAEGVMVLEDDEAVCRQHGLTAPGTREEIYRLRRQRADAIVEHGVSETSRGANLSTKLGRWTLHPVWGGLILVGFLALMYVVLGIGLAQKVVEVTEGVWMGEYYTPWIAGLVGRVIPAQSFIGQVLVGEFGLLTMTVSYLLGLLLPLVAGFYLFLSFMEDSGYLPRVAVLVDRWMTKVGLNGRAVIPMILGFGCVTMATVTTRLMGTQRERTIATFLLSLAIPCSAQLAVIAVMLAPLGIGYAITFAAILLIVYGVAGALLNRLLPGQSSDLLIDLPPLRFPRWGNVFKKTYLKAKGFITEAWIFFAAGSLLISVLNASGALTAIEGSMAPITESWLGLPRAAAGAFLMGFIRRDFGAAGLMDLNMTPHQTLISLTTLTLFVPCIASIMIMLKERGKKEGALIWVADLGLAVFIGGLLNRLLFW